MHDDEEEEEEAVVEDDAELTIDKMNDELAVSFTELSNCASFSQIDSVLLFFIICPVQRYIIFF